MKKFVIVEAAWNDLRMQWIVERRVLEHRQWVKENEIAISTNTRE